MDRCRESEEYDAEDSDCYGWCVAIDDDCCVVWAHGIGKVGIHVASYWLCLACHCVYRFARCRRLGCVVVGPRVRGPGLWKPSCYAAMHLLTYS